MNRLLNLFEQMFVLTSLAFLIGNPIPLLSEFELISISLKPRIYLFIYLISFCLLLIRPKRNLELILSKNKLIWVVIGIATASFAWSLFLKTTIFRLALMLGAASFGTYFAIRFSLKQQLRLLALAFGIAAVMSLVFCLFLPQYGVMDQPFPGAWRGTFLHKNILGRNMSVSALLFLVFLSVEQRFKLASLLFLTLSILLVILSQSATALIILTTNFALLFFYRIFKWSDKSLFSTLFGMMTVGAISAILLVTYEGNLFSLIGKESNLTGRTDFWPYIWDMIMERPLLGYGYEGFWRGWDSPAAYVWSSSGWVFNHAHNGLLQLMLHIGIIGASFYLIVYFETFLKAVAKLRTTKGSEYYWPLVYLSFLFFSNITETNVMSDEIFWALYVSVCLL